MSPHAVSLGSEESTSPTSRILLPSYTSQVNGAHQSKLPATNGDYDELFDLICVGFGPSSLAIATALDDAIEWRSHDPPRGANGELPRVCFLEKQTSFAWHANMQLPGAKMQVSWLKDLATFRNPQSRFTFLNYLGNVGRLVSFTNLSTFFPLRKEMESYMQWCAEAFSHVTEYSQHVTEVSPDADSPQAIKPISSFIVKSRDLETGVLVVRRARHVIIGTGGQPRIPSHLPQHHPRVIHSANYLSCIQKQLPDSTAAYKVIVVGAGQSAAEVFCDLRSRYPNCRSQLLIRSAALRPSDDSPFVNETFDPARVDATFVTDADTRAADIADDKATNYGVVRIELLEQMCNDLYEQRLHSLDEETWAHRILPFRSVTKIEDGSSQVKVKVSIKNLEGIHGRAGSKIRNEQVEVDAVVIAAGYDKNGHEKLLQNARHLMPCGPVEGKKWTVTRDYRLKFQEGKVLNAGVWLQGCNEQTHGLGDSLLSNLATRGGEIVESVFYA